MYYLILGCRPGRGISIAGPHPRRLKPQTVLASQFWSLQSAVCTEDAGGVASSVVHEGSQASQLGL